MWRRGESIGNQSAVSSPAVLLVDPLTLLVLIPLVIFLLLLFPWLAASYGVEKKGEEATGRRKQERKEIFRGALARFI
jgi:hypothetical protein